MKCGFALAVSPFLVASGWAQEVDSIIDYVTRVDLNVQVTQGNRAVRNLRHQDFRVWDEGVASRVVTCDYPFAPLNVVLLLGLSTSPKERQAELATVARQALGPQGKLSMMVFDEDTNEAIAACARQLNELPGKFREQRAIIVVSDNPSRHRQTLGKQLLRELDRARAVLHVIAPGGLGLFQLARETGGEVVKSRQMGRSLQEMLERIQHRYSMSYSPPPFELGQTRRIEVSLTPEARKKLGSPKPKVLTRLGYTVYPMR